MDERVVAAITVLRILSGILEDLVKVGELDDRFLRTRLDDIATHLRKIQPPRLCSTCGKES